MEDIANTILQHNQWAADHAKSFSAESAFGYLLAKNEELAKAILKSELDKREQLNNAPAPFSEDPLSTMTEKQEI